MISFEEASAITMAETLSLETEKVPLAEGLHRFLVHPVASPLDAPPFDKAAMDGYAVRGDDVRTEYTVRETIAAGGAPLKDILGPGEAAKIMTGAPLPPGAGKVIRVEFTEFAAGRVRILQEEPHQNVIRQGENIHAGDPLLEPGKLGPKEIGCLAAAGIGEIEVFRRVRMGVITTGDELRSAGSVLKYGEIFDSNGPQLASQIRVAGAEAVSYGIVADSPEDHREAVKKGLGECDFLLLSGGVSKGDFDYVPGVLQEAGVDIRYHGVKVKPGRPTLFGRTDDTLVFGLPGNPVSVFVIFESLVRPLLHQIQGAPAPGVRIRGRLTGPVKRRDTERAEFLPVAVGGDEEGVLLTPVKYGGSSHLNALAGADALMAVPAGVGRLETGAMVNARLL